MSTNGDCSDASGRLDPRELREVFGMFATGVTVITTGRDGIAEGMTANAFASVSLDPPLVLVCVKNGGRAAREIAAAGRFTVNILAAGQEALSVRFASRDRPRGADAFRDVPHRLSDTGAPILDGSAAHLDCRTVASHDAGDHTVFIAEVVRFGAEPSAGPLLFHDGRYRRVA